MTVLVAADLSARSANALSRACQVAKHLGQDVTALHVVDRNLPDDFRQQSVDWAKKTLQGVIDQVPGAAAAKITGDVRQASPRQCIIEQANAEGVSLLVFGVHDGADNARGFAQTTAGRALAGSVPPALLVTKKPDDDYRNVVVGIDFSLSSRAAIRQALAIAPEAKIHLVHAYHAPFIGLSASPGLAEEVAYQHKLEFDKFVQEEMALLQDQARGMGAVADNLHRVIRQGAPQTVLKQACEDVNADLLVIATQGRGAISRAIWGSVAADMLDNPPCDVLVIKPF